MNEQYDASVDGLLLFQRLASPSHSINALCLQSVLDALSNALPNQFCTVNIRRDFTLIVVDDGAKDAKRTVLAASGPEAKVASPKYLSPLLCWKLLPPEFTSRATHVKMSQKWLVSAKSDFEADGD